MSDMEENVKQLEYQDMFADMGIGRGKSEFERGKLEIYEMYEEIIEDDEYEAIVMALKAWCEVGNR